jgi:hypothetical protein
MPSPRTLVRCLVGTALALALAGFVFLPVPVGPPAIALGQPSLYRLEVALAIFYGCLLLLTPAYSGMVDGRLPTEISTRGAKFAEESDMAVEQNEASIRELERRSDRLSECLEKATDAINQLRSEGEVTRHDER